MREKILKDVATQRTRLAMAIEKLMVHFRERTYPGYENQMVLRVGEISLELGRLQADVDQQCQTLSVCLSQEEQYQQDLQRLRQLLAMSERQLKIACSPAMSLQEKQEQLKLQKVSDRSLLLVFAFTVATAPQLHTKSASLLYPTALALHAPANS